ncbi:MAG: transglutaminase domain-containing protein [Haloarculaceae archaeon]
MAEDTEFETGTSREYVRVLLVACCLLAVVVAGAVVPALSTGDGESVAGSPIESTLPDGAVAGGGAEVPSGGSDGDGSGDGGGSLGALSPGSFAGVGGPVDENAFRSQDATTHFTVRSTEPAYWRTGAYGEYAGSGWGREGEVSPYEGPIPGSSANGSLTTYEVTLNRSATALPTVWRPRTVEGIDDLGVTGQRAVLPAEPLSPGATFTGTSDRPPRDPAVLRSTGRDYPEAIEERYTALPDSVPDRVGEFTGDLTADADDPYETARTVEAWLEENKEYSLNVSRRSENIADTFIFEMDRGYCEYYATSMVVMLRSQGVPARYVVGYSTGQQVAENTYQVRNLNAHAWVEVYFEDVGWVKFDPTPGGARLDSEQSAVRNQEPTARYSPTERGSPGERFTPGSDAVDSDPVDTTGPSDRTESGVLVALNRTPVPGATVEMTLTENATPVAGARVSLNGEAVGVTGDDGTLVTTVPYVDRLTVEVETPERNLVYIDQTANATNATDDRTTDSRAAVPLGAGPPAPSGQPLVNIGPGPNAVTYPVETNATVRVTGQPRAGGTVTVVATVDGVPVRDAVVRVGGEAVTRTGVNRTEADGDVSLVGGETVARTDADGRAEVTLPEEPGNVTVAVERGPVSGATTVQVPALSVEVEPTAPLSLPLTEATVTARLGDRPLAGTPVVVDGEQVATTDSNGTATVTLPLSGSTTVTVSDGSVTARETVDGLLLNLLLVLVGVAAAVGGLVVGARRLGYGARGLLALARRLPGLAVRYAQLALVMLATDGGDLLRAGLAGLRGALGALADLFRGRTGVADLKARLRAWSRERRPGRAPRGDAVAGGDAEGGRVTVRAAWRRLVEGLSVRRPETKTPGELAAHGVERDGLPADAVHTLRDTYREVEYGARAADDRLQRVQSALAAIERAGGPDADAAADTGPRGVAGDDAAGADAVGDGTAADGGRAAAEPRADGTHTRDGNEGAADTATDPGREGE